MIGTLILRIAQVGPSLVLATYRLDLPPHYETTGCNSLTEEYQVKINTIEYSIALAYSHFTYRNAL